MNTTSRIYVAGHTGLVGTAITGCLNKKGFSKLITRTIDELNLIDQRNVDEFFRTEKPEYIFLAAARVGGIMANNTYRADFIYDNLMIQSNIVHSAYKYGAKKIIFLGSTCIYPRDAPQPLKEEYLLTSPLEYTNEPYAVAKIAGLKMCESYNIQHGTNFIAVMPTNLYGPSDNYDLEKSHVLPALLRKFFLCHCLEENDLDAIHRDIARNPVKGLTESSTRRDIEKTLEKSGIIIRDGLVTVRVWGSGSPLREFMHSRDMAEACVFLMQNVDVEQILEAHKKKKPSLANPPHFLNIGTGEEITIKELALKLRDISGFRGAVEFDATKPDGTLRKVTDTTILKSLGFKPKTSLDEGLKEVYGMYANK